MRILKLSAENVKRIKAVEIVPSGDLVVIAGKNDAGKSSILDAIEMAMGGEARTPPAPVRRGQKKATVILDLGDYIVKRTLGADGSRKLTVENKDGARFPSPQALLDRLYSDLSFDPLAFERMDRKAQAETLRGLVGLDVSDLEGKRQRLYDERAEVNQEIRALEVTADGLVPDADTPAEEVSIEAIAAELEAAETRQQELSAARVVYRDRTADMEKADGRRLAAVNEIAILTRRLADLEAAVPELELELSHAQEAVALATKGIQAAAADVPDTGEIRERLKGAERLNTRVRGRRQYDLAVQALENAKGRSRHLTTEIAGVDAEKQERLEKAAFPVDGLGFDEEGVTLGGLPFEQASTSDRIRVSVAIGLASNPSLKVLLVRDGSLIGQEKLEILAQMATAAGAQVWLEMLQEAPDAQTSVYIEDGSVRETVQPSLPDVGPVFHSETETLAETAARSATPKSGQRRVKP